MASEYPGCSYECHLRYGKHINNLRFDERQDGARAFLVGKMATKHANLRYCEPQNDDRAFSTFEIWLTTHQRSTVLDTRMRLARITAHHVLVPEQWT